MNAELLLQILFYVFASVAIGSAVAVVSVKNTVYSALLLVLCFFSSAALWLLIEAEFLAITLILVYVGAVMVLFLFVVMMLDIKQSRAAQLKQTYTQAALLVAAAMFVQLLMLLGYRMQDDLPSNELIRQGADYSNVTELAMALFTQYVYPFEIAAVILLIAIIAAILLTLRDGKRSQHMGPSKQVQVKPSDRIRIVKIDARKGNGEGQ